MLKTVQLLNLTKSCWLTTTVTVGAPTVDGAKVVCEVASHLVKGDKVLVFHKKRRKGYKKLNGHRQQFTELTIKQVIA